MRKQNLRRNRGIVEKCLVLMFQSDPVLGVNLALVVNLWMIQRVLAGNSKTMHVSPTNSKKSIFHHPMMVIWGASHMTVLWVLVL